MRKSKRCINWLQVNEATAAEAASRAERAVEEEKRSAEAREEQTRLVHDFDPRWSGFGGGA